MGQFTVAELDITFNNEDKAEEFAKIISNFKEELSKRRIAKGLDTDFDTSINFVEADGNYMRILLNSNRTPNAEWQCDQISQIAKEEFREYIVIFEAEITVPENYIYWDVNDEETED
jgi:hypothetical protein